MEQKRWPHLQWLKEEEEEEGSLKRGHPAEKLTLSPARIWSGPKLASDGGLVASSLPFLPKEKRKRSTESSTPTVGKKREGGRPNNVAHGRTVGEVFEMVAGRGEISSKGDCGKNAWKIERKSWREKSKRVIEREREREIQTRGQGLLWGLTFEAKDCFMSVVSVSGPICRAYKAGLNKISSFTHVHQIPLPPAFRHRLIVSCFFSFSAGGLLKKKKKKEGSFNFCFDCFLMTFMCLMYIFK